MKWFLTVMFAGMTIGLTHAADPKPGDRLERKGDEIIVCGQLIHTGTPVVTWLDPGGYDAYRVERRFAPAEKASWAARAAEKKDAKPNRFFPVRKSAELSPEKYEELRGGWDLPALQSVVDQFVIHFDATGTSQKCFQVLQDERDLSVHFMLDLDGTLYQSLDLKEAAWHATKANHRSIGIEIANLGTTAVGPSERLDRWYKKQGSETILTVPDPIAAKAIRNKSITLKPSRPDPIVGMVQGQKLQQYDLTPQQYEALIKLTATLHSVFPKIRVDYPRGQDGKLLPVKLPDAEYDKYQGLLGHYHVQLNKVDPGPAFQWDKLIDGVKKIEASR
jgi:N-acetyl-anhydromuramyl-L-alanine amidase AmpD